MPENQISSEFLKMLVCPISWSPLVQEGDWLVTEGEAEKRRYPVRDGIPVMLVEESEILSDDGKWVKHS